MAVRVEKKYKQVKDDARLAEVLGSEVTELRHMAFQCVNMTADSEAALAHTYRDCLFVDCTLPMGLKRQSSDCLFLPDMGELFHYRSRLYSPEELYEGYDPSRPSTYDKCYDGMVYRHYLRKGKRESDVKETLARCLHDHSISDCLYDFLSEYDEHRLIGVMGGHGLARTDDDYRQIARLSKRLTEDGFLMVTGGGPGAMEATHLGAWMAGRTEEELDDAWRMLHAAPTFNDGGWLETAWQVHDKYPQTEYRSLGVPTWLYGHEPSTPLATHIAKYFDNSIREDGILNIAKGGIIYTPGSAGTLQEIFQEAVQNHYLTFGYSSPMIFFGERFWTKEVPVWTLINWLLEKGKYKNLLLTLTDSLDEVERVLKESSSGRQPH